MTATLYTELAWLPRPPDDFPALCRSLPSKAEPGSAVRALAGHALDEDQLSRLGRAVARCVAEGRPLAPLRPFRLGLLGNSTLDLLTPMLVASAARHGLALECIRADYGQTTQEALNPVSSINAAKPDAVLLAIDHRGLPLRFEPGDADVEEAAIEGALNHLNAIRKGIRAHSGGVCIVQTLPPPPETLFGSFDRVLRELQRALIDRLNRADLRQHRRVRGRASRRGRHRGDRRPLELGIRRRSGTWRSWLSTTPVRRSTPTTSRG